MKTGCTKLKVKSHGLLGFINDRQWLECSNSKPLIEFICCYGSRRLRERKRWHCCSPALHKLLSSSSPSAAFSSVLSSPSVIVSSSVLAVIQHWEGTWRGKVYWGHRSQPLTEGKSRQEVKCGRNLEVGTKAEAIEERCALVFWLTQCSACLLIEPGPTYTGVTQPTTATNKKKLHTHAHGPIWS